MPRVLDASAISWPRLVFPACHTYTRQEAMTVRWCRESCPKPSKDRPRARRRGRLRRLWQPSRPRLDCHRSGPAARLGMPAVASSTGSGVRPRAPPAMAQAVGRWPPPLTRIATV